MRFPPHMHFHRINNLAVQTIPLRKQFRHTYILATQAILPHMQSRHANNSTAHAFPPRNRYRRVYNLTAQTIPLHIHSRRVCNLTAYTILPRKLSRRVTDLAAHRRCQRRRSSFTMVYRVFENRLKSIRFSDRYAEKHCFYIFNYVFMHITMY